MVDAPEAFLQALNSRELFSKCRLLFGGTALTLPTENVSAPEEIIFELISETAFLNWLGWLGEVSGRV